MKKPEEVKYHKNCHDCGRFVMKRNQVPKTYIEENKDEVYAIHYEEAGMDPEIIIGTDEAYKILDMRKDSWNCYLFKLVKSEARGER